MKCWSCETTRRPPLNSFSASISAWIVSMSVVFPPYNEKRQHGVTALSHTHTHKDYTAQPANHRTEVVRRLVQHHDVRLLVREEREGRAGLLAPGEEAHGLDGVVPAEAKLPDEAPELLAVGLGDWGWDVGWVGVGV